MALRDLLPLNSRLIQEKPKQASPAINIADTRALPKLFKVISLAVGFTGGTYSLGFNRVNFEPAPYDFGRILQAIDTDSYVKQAFHKYQELMWKEGWSIVGENKEAVDYLYTRLAFMELSMQQPIQDFFVNLTDQLIKFSNAFVVKIRGDLQPYFPRPLKAAAGNNPVIGYQIVPAETMEIMRDYHNKVIQYRQDVWGAYGYNAAASGFGSDQRDYANLLPTWRPEEVIHFKLDEKPGRIFGTPFMVAVMDDVIALRQVEEDIQNLVHRELFPLYKYKVGTENHPAEPEEIINAANELTNLRTEGGLVLPDRHDVEVVGANGQVLEADQYLEHFKERVAVGLGLSKHHLGMMSGAGNRATADNLDTALYDKIKLRQRYVADMLQINVFNELLLEGGFDPYIPSITEDKCVFVFNEIDVDTQIKKENHEIQKWVSDMVTWPEMRLALKMNPDADEQNLYSSLSSRMKSGPGVPMKIAPAPPPLSPAAGGGARSALNPSSAKPPSATVGGASNVAKKPDAARPGNQPKRPPRQKAVANTSRPANQHGRNLSPKIQHSDWLNDIVELLDDDNGGEK